MTKFIRLIAAAFIFLFLLVLPRRRLLNLLLAAVLFLFITPAAFARRAMGRSNGWRRGKPRGGWRAVSVSTSNRVSMEGLW
jgi:hypothetical protein